jgi:SET domain-containing protein
MPSSDNPNFLVRQVNEKVGRGLFATRRYLKGQVIRVFKGTPKHISELPKEYSPDDPSYLQVGKNHYFADEGVSTYYLNHSCNPNAGIKFAGNKIKLVAIQFIGVDDEITFDYSTTSYRSGWSMNCECSAQGCRKVIGDFADLPTEVKEYYIRLGVVAPYCLEDGDI